MSTLRIIRNTPVIHQIYKSSILPRARIKYDKICSYIQKNRSGLDIGCGNGGVLYLLNKTGYQFQGVDIYDHNFFTKNIIEVYSGAELPYSDKQFEYGLLLTVLHHSKDPEFLLKEAGRVCNVLIIVEDIYTGHLNRKILFFMDSLVNFEWRGHPHTNKTEKEWEEIFSKLSFNVLKKEAHRILWIFKQVTYVVST